MNVALAQEKPLTTVPDTLDRLWERVDRIKVGMLTSVGVHGLLVSRPMMTQEVDPSGWLWFLIDGGGALAQSVRRDPRVNVSYSDADDGVFASISGRAQIVYDEMIAKALWSPAVATWLPGGIGDPHLALLRVTVERAEYWTNSGKMAQLLNVAKAALMQTPPREIGEHHTFEF